MKTTQEIIQNDPKIKASKADWKRLYSVIYQSVKSNKYRVLRHKDTLCWIELLPDSGARYTIFTADSPEELPALKKEFIQAMQAAGFRNIEEVQ